MSQDSPDSSDTSPEVSPDVSGPRDSRWWTIEDVQAYLGHQSLSAARVWLSRHGIRSVSHFSADDVRLRRGRTKPPTDDKDN